VKVVGAYCYFCDDNDLPRIDATPRQEIENIDRMMAALMVMRRQAVRARRRQKMKDLMDAFMSLFGL